jgi:hypothetical protein
MRHTRNRPLFPTPAGAAPTSPLERPYTRHFVRPHRFGPVQRLDEVPGFRKQAHGLPPTERFGASMQSARVIEPLRAPTRRSRVACVESSLSAVAVVADCDRGIDPSKHVVARKVPAIRFEIRSFPTSLYVTIDASHASSSLIGEPCGGLPEFGGITASGVRSLKSPTDTPVTGTANSARNPPTELSRTGHSSCSD